MEEVAFSVIFRCDWKQGIREWPGWGARVGSGGRGAVHCTLSICSQSNSFAIFQLKY